ncbi:MAG TPA: hypothetical protein VL171_17730 [Verrucomicrobiae bacterium]|nr:hypothetical protein [Verrucomicrobiae bacterium]
MGKWLLTALIVGTILLVDLMAASPALHEVIHRDAGEPDHHCVVTLFAHGQVNSAVCKIVAPTIPIWWIDTVPPVTFLVAGPLSVLLPPSRAPPSPRA